MKKVNQINHGLIKEENFTINLCNVLMDSTHNGDESVITERCLKTWQLIIANLVLVIWICQ